MKTFLQTLLIGLFLSPAFFLNAQTISTVFTASGSFQVPVGVMEITVEAWGAGGGGALNAMGARGGGAGGAYAKSTLAVTPGDMIPFTVGVGGANGVAGTNSTWNGSTVIAAGGGAGSGTSGGDFGGGSVGDIFYSGGNGDDASGNNGGGGGGSAFTGASGGNGIGTAGGIGTGNGGGGGIGNNDGANGSAPGGGGGGKGGPGAGFSSGAGANGQIIVTYLNPLCATLTLAQGDVIQPQCFGGTDGFVSVVVTGGTPTYMFSWEGHVSTDSIRTGLVAGMYKVYVEDSANCIDSLTIILGQPTQVSITLDNITNETCPGAANGSIKVTATGGTGMVSYLWSNSETSDLIEDLTAGMYTVTATDMNNCTATATYQVQVQTDVIAPTLNITGSPAVVDCADLMSATPTADQLAALALAGSLNLGTADNCSLADTTYMITNTQEVCINNDDDIVRVYTISVVVIDGSGNTAAGQFLVHIIDDFSTPLFTIFNAGVTINCEDPVPAPQWIPAFAAGACVFANTSNIAIALDNTVSTQSMDLLVCEHYNYTITRTYTLTHHCNGNTQTIDFVVNVQDMEAPLLDGDFLDDAVTFAVNYAENDVDGDNLAITARANNFDDVPSCLGCLEIDFATANFITDNCASFQTLEILYQVTENGVTVIGDPDPVVFKAAGAATPTVLDRCYPIGISTVAFTIVDACLNAEEYIITIQVLDLNPPIIEGCPADMAVEALEGNCSRIVEWLPPTAEDCSDFEENLWAVGSGGQELIILGPNADGEWYAEFSVGINTVYHEFIDIYGNADTCIFTVTVIGADECGIIPIPTMSEWGLIILSLFMMIGALLYIRQRNHVLSLK